MYYCHHHHRKVMKRKYQRWKGIKRNHHHHRKEKTTNLSLCSLSGKLFLLCLFTVNSSLSIIMIVIIKAINIIIIVIIITTWIWARLSLVRGWNMGLSSSLDPDVSEHILWWCWWWPYWRWWWWWWQWWWYVIWWWGWRYPPKLQARPAGGKCEVSPQLPQAGKIKFQILNIFCINWNQIKTIII